MSKKILISLYAVEIFFLFVSFQKYSKQIEKSGIIPHIINLLLRIQIKTLTYAFVIVVASTIVSR